MKRERGIRTRIEAFRPSGDRGSAKGTEPSRFPGCFKEGLSPILMHEVAIARNIIEIAENEARKHGASSIRTIKLRVGEFRGVVKEALEFAFCALGADTMAAGAELEVETVKLRVECRNCGPVECELNDFNLLCLQCGSALTITAGRELSVEYLDLE